MINPEIQKEFAEKLLEIRRVTRVVAGGKRFRFRATIVVGNRKGMVGIGVAKGSDVASSIEKARRDAQKNLIRVNLKDGRTIEYEIRAKYSAASILIKPARNGHGIKAGGASQAVLQLAGIRDATAKVLGNTKNKLTNAMATLNALKKLSS